MPNIIIAGIGGQGVVTSARVLGNIAMNSGFDVKVSEIHGMSQRGGNVEAHVTIGEKVYSPVIEKGKADILIDVNNILSIDTDEIIRKSQDRRCINMVLLGRVCSQLEYEYDCCIETIKKEIKKDYIDKFIIAFKHGYFDVDGNINEGAWAYPEGDGYSSTLTRV
ncbi:2-oxoacid:acceptor oxidoreductase family protein [Anaerosporobacter sp.]